MELENSNFAEMEIHVEDDEFEEEVDELLDVPRDPNRPVYQQQLAINRLLPYASRLDTESEVWLLEILEGLSKSVLTGDYRPGLLNWTFRLSQYINQFGRKFTKEQHIDLVHLYFGLITDPDTECSLLSRFCSVYRELLRCERLLSPDDLQIDWRKIYDVYERVICSRDARVGLLGAPRGLDRSLTNVIAVSRPYFSKQSTNEMLALWRPLLYPHSESVKRPSRYMGMFLPTLSMKEDFLPWKAWFGEVMDLWLAFPGSPAWEDNLSMLLSRLATDSIGRITWAPYIPQIFNKLLSKLQLPVGKRQFKRSVENPFSAVHVWPKWIAAMLHEETCLYYFEVFCKAVESFFHPANTGGHDAFLLYMIVLRLPLSLVDRVNWERYRKPTWVPPTLSSAKLNDQQISRFVKAIKPLLMLNVFSKNAIARMPGPYSIKCLAEISPAVAQEFIPELLDKLYPALDSLTEPHRLTALMGALTVSLPELSNIPEGRKHILPLMLAVLPGIDSNDVIKSASTFGFLSLLVSLVPLCDCSSLAEREDLTAEEKDFCIESAGFEDFALMCVERCLTFIGNLTNDLHAHNHGGGSGPEVTNKVNHEEKLNRAGMASLLATLFHQSSDAICRAMCQKIYSFVSGRIFIYNHFSATALSTACMMVMRLRPKIAEEELLAPLMALMRVRVTLHAKDIENDETVDEETAWILKLAVDIVQTAGKSLMQYEATLMTCLPILLSAKSMAMFKLGGWLARSMLHGLLIVVPRGIKVPEHNAVEESPELAMVRRWRPYVNPNDVEIEWRVPDADTVAFAEKFISFFLIPALNKLKDHVSGEALLERKALERTLILVEMYVLGGAAAFPFYSDRANQRPPCSSAVEMYSAQPDPVISMEEMEIKIGGNPAREEVFRHLQPVLHKISAADEDDVKSIKTILRIFRALMFYRGIEGDELMAKARGHQMTRRQLGKAVGFGKEEHRLLLVERAAIQHSKRMNDHSGSPMTVLRAAIMKEMVYLATSPYKEVRILGQNYFSDALRNVRFGYLPFVDTVVELLAASKDDPSRKHQMKGCLYLILGGRSGSLLMKHDWGTLRKTVTHLVRIGSDSKTVPRVLDKLAEKWDRNFITRTIHIKPSVAVGTAESILTKLGRNTDLELGAIWDKRRQESQRNEENYLAVIHDMITCLQERNTKPKNYHFTLFLLGSMVRRDMPVLPELVQCYLENWVNPVSEKVRQLAQQPIYVVLNRIRREKVKIEVPVPAAKLEDNERVLVGIRPDNEWLCFDERSLPTTEMEYESTVFIDKPVYGYYGWPEKLVVAAPIKDQPRPADLLESMSPAEEVIHKKFTDPSYVEAFVRLWTAEGLKYHSKYDPVFDAIFKYLFRHFGDAFLETLLPHLEKAVTSKEEPQHRFAAEVLTGMITGSKFWPFASVSRLWEKLVPLLKTALGHLTVESLSDWGKFAKATFNVMDARRHYPLLSVLFDVPKGETTFQTSSRLFVLYKAFWPEFDWRKRQLHEKILNMMRAVLLEPYRERVAYLLTCVFRADIALPNLNKGIQQGPSLVSFLQELLPHCLECTAPKVSSQTEELDRAMKVLKLTAKFIPLISIASDSYLPTEIQSFLPVMFRFENDARDEELKMDALKSVATLATIPLSLKGCETALDQVARVLSSSSDANPTVWRDKTVALEYLQTVIFRNLFLMKSKPDFLNKTRALVLSALEDESVEVRQVAGGTLSGLVQCGYLSMPKSMLDQFWKQAEGSSMANDRTKRHAGVLGLCAYLLAFPYSVEKFTPDILIVLSGHVNDPQPICQTVKNAIKEFRRTHQDTWSEHKSKFTEDQLVALTDLLVSPTYYA